MFAVLEAFRYILLIASVQVVWHKNGAIITEASPRMTGADFKIRKGMLEMEDAAESDSGKYMCEVGRIEMPAFPYLLFLTKGTI